MDDDDSFIKGSSYLKIWKVPMTKKALYIARPHSVFCQVSEDCGKQTFLERTSLSTGIIFSILRDR